MAALLSYYTGILALTFVSILVYVLSSEVQRRRLPPGPQPIPFLGNKHQVPNRKPWFKFKEWNEKYGPIISLHLGRTPVIVLGTAQAAWDLLDRRSDIYSSRPRFVVAGEILSENLRGLMLPYGEDWRRFRKVLHSGLHIRRAETYIPSQSLESKVALKQILEQPEDWEKHIQRYAASVVVSLSYGRRINGVDEWIVKENMNAMDCTFTSSIPGKYLVESWPWLLKLPRYLQWFRAEPERQRQRDVKLYTTLVNDVKARMADNTCPDCLTSQILINEGLGPEIGHPNTEGRHGRTMSELEVAYTVSSPFGAGIETTAGTLSSFVLAMLHYPHIIDKAQEELDSVVGQSRMPEIEDKTKLPYINAIVNETLRWRPVAILGGTPHAVTADDEYKGMFIPKGSTVFANFASIMHDPTTFPSPDQFIPERFLPKSPLYNPQMDPFDLPFGFGRRICPGMHLARNSIFMNISRLLWAFDIKPALDSNDCEVIPDSWNYTEGFNSRPVSFNCRFAPRNDKVVDVIRREGELALESLERWT
ncbi:cytochrome P450 [Abortiporus biennis]|nr:cytochrome P450 [Abortiporus biennis]